MNTQLAAHQLSKLGNWLGLFAEAEPLYPGTHSGLTQAEFDQFLEAKNYAQMANAWFTNENINQALKGWSESLKEIHVQKWLANYTLQPIDKAVAIIMAGNIPLVGLHDLLCALVAGHQVMAKTSKDDSYLIKAVAKLITLLNPDLVSRITFVEERKLEGFDKVIATGSNNTSRYFDYYFGKYPHIIRKNRNAVAVISETDTKETLQELGKDMFTFFGLGCRNVSKVYFPEGFDKDIFFNAIYSYNEVVNHHKYANNYDYHKALYLMNGDDLLDNEFLLLKESEVLAAPVGVVFYEHYSSREALNQTLQNRAEEIQCIVGEGYLPFGQAQTPMLWDYADGVDTLAFLLES